MRKINLLFFIFFFACNGFCLEITVSPDHSDNVGSNDQRTLKGAYERLLHLFPAKIVDEKVTITIIKDCFLAVSPQTLTCLIWEISGTKENQIIISSGKDIYRQIKRPEYDNSKQSYILEIQNANYITIQGLKFPEATVGIFINSSDYCSILDCQFYGNQIMADGGSGTIALTRHPISFDLPKYNKIKYNYIKADGAATVVGDYKKSHGYALHHGIYLAQSEFNDVEYNTIINPPGYGIHYWHGYSQNNNVSSNIINVCDDGEAKGGFLMGYGDCTNPGCTSSSVFGNVNNKNYITYSNPTSASGNTYYFPNNTRAMMIMDSLKNSNPNFEPNYFNHADNCGNRYVIDPYWVNYDAKPLMDRIVTGDFDGDGFLDDIAALYDLGNQHAQIHVWLNKMHLEKDPENENGSQEQEKSFQFEGAWWSSNALDLSKISGRFVSGDFDGDGSTDLAALHDEGNGTSRLLVWTSNGKSFSPEVKPETWWCSNKGAYDATKVDGRFVVGDFNADGKVDVAAMYDYGNSTSRIHVWYSNGKGFDAPSTPWKSNKGAYAPSKVTNRFMCGDFNGDGKKDIAALYDYGSKGSAIHVWISTGSGFTSDGSTNTFWSTNGVNSYNSQMLANRIVCGDFNDDGMDDIAGMYDYGKDNTKIHCWTSDGKSFSAPETKWISFENGYDPDKISGRFFSGDFNNDGKMDLGTLFDYSYDPMFYRSRTHVWESDGSNFNLMNGLLGYPWMMEASKIGMECKH